MVRSAAQENKFKSFFIGEIQREKTAAKERGKCSYSPALWYSTNEEKTMTEVRPALEGIQP